MGSCSPRRDLRNVQAHPMSTQIAPEMIYRVVTDYEGVQDAFADRIEDINVPLTEVDVVAGMKRGNMQKLLVKSDAKWAREFGWKTLGDALRGTGMVLAFILDDEKFAPIKAQMMKRKAKMRPNGSIKPPKWLITSKRSAVMQTLRNQKLTERQRHTIAKRAAQIRWRRAKARKSAQQVTG
jgi:hypothetical protein